MTAALPDQLINKAIDNLSAGANAIMISSQLVTINRRVDYLTLINFMSRPETFQS
jgi:hypothetical protein